MQQLTLAELDAEYTRRLVIIHEKAQAMPVSDTMRALDALNRWWQEIVERVPRP